MSDFYFSETEYDSESILRELLLNDLIFPQRNDKGEPLLKIEEENNTLIIKWNGTGILKTSGTKEQRWKRALSDILLHGFSHLYEQTKKQTK